MRLDRLTSVRSLCVRARAKLDLSGSRHFITRSDKSGVRSEQRARRNSGVELLHPGLESMSQERLKYIRIGIVALSRGVG